MQAATTTVLLCAIGLSGCITSASEPEAESSALLAIDAGPECAHHVWLELDGVTCPACKEILESNLIAMHGVVGVRVTLDPPQGEVQHCDGVTPEDLVAAVKTIGYGAKVRD